MSHIIDTYLAATPAQLDHGTHWYDQAHWLAGTAVTPGDPDAGAGVIAALSPQTGWDANLANAVRLARGQHVTYMVSRDMRVKAERILLGEDWRDVLGGRKVRAFAQVIAMPDDPWTVVIDRHALAVYYGHTPTTTEKAAFARKGGYETVANAYRAAALMLDMTPATVQAVTWLVWRSRAKDNRLPATEKAHMVGKVSA